MKKGRGEGGWKSSGLDIQGRWEGGREREGGWEDRMLVEYGKGTM